MLYNNISEKSVMLLREICYGISEKSVMVLREICYGIPLASPYVVGVCEGSKRIEKNLKRG